jgi:hypothetical protein
MTRDSCSPASGVVGVRCSWFRRRGSTIRVGLARLDPYHWGYPPRRQIVSTRLGSMSPRSTAACRIFVHWDRTTGGTPHWGAAGYLGFPHTKRRWTTANPQALREARGERDLRKLGGKTAVEHFHRGAFPDGGRATDCCYCGGKSSHLTHRSAGSKLPERAVQLKIAGI